NCGGGGVGRGGFPKGVLVVYVAGARDGSRPLEPARRNPLVVVGRDPTSALGDARQPLQLDEADGGLYLGHTEVEADAIVHVWLAGITLVSKAGAELGDT